MGQKRAIALLQCWQTCTCSLRITESSMKCAIVFKALNGLAPAFAVETYAVSILSLNIINPVNPELCNDCRTILIFLKLFFFFFTVSKKVFGKKVFIEPSDN